jgi:acetyl-CoA carboxylase carboxyltransferase component
MAVDGAKMVCSIRSAKFTVIVSWRRKLCDVEAYDPRLIFVWPSAELAVIPRQKVLAQIEASSLKQGELVDEARKELFDKIKARYDEQVSSYYAASRLWTDAIIDP